MISLYDKPECPFCWKVRLALAESEAVHQLLDYQQEPHSSVWPELTPGNTVPVLVDNDIVIHESSVIMECLQDAYGGLLPAEPQKRVKARLLASFSDGVVGKAVREVIFEKRGRAEDEWDWQRIEQGTQAWQEMLPYLAEQLGKQLFFAGEYSLADMALTARFGLAYAYGLSIPEEHVNLIAWFHRVTARPSFTETAPTVVLSQLDNTQNPMGTVSYV